MLMSVCTYLLMCVCVYPQSCEAHPPGPVYLSPADELHLQVHPQAEGEGSAQHRQPGHQPQALGQADTLLQGELHLEGAHGSLTMHRLTENQETRERERGEGTRENSREKERKEAQGIQVKDGGSLPEVARRVPTNHTQRLVEAFEEGFKVALLIVLQARGGSGPVACCVGELLMG